MNTFPDDRDRELIDRARRLDGLAADLADWVTTHNQARKDKALLPISERHRLLQGVKRE